MLREKERRDKSSGGSGSSNASGSGGGGKGKGNGSDSSNKTGKEIQCYRCKKFGHKKDKCTAKSCKNCNSFEHKTEECKYDSPVCSYCKEPGHFRRECPKRKETVKEGKGKRAAFAGGLTFTI